MEERKRKRAEEKTEERVEAKFPKLDHLSYAELWEEAKKKRMILKKHIGAGEEYNKLRNVINYNMTNKYWSTIARVGMRDGMFGHPAGNRYMLECGLEAVNEALEELNA